MKEWCEQCKKESEILETKLDEWGHPVKVLECGHEITEVFISDSGKGIDKVKVERLWDSISLTLTGILISVGLTVGFGVGSLTRNLLLGIASAVFSPILMFFVLKRFRNSLIKFINRIFES